MQTVNSRIPDNRHGSGCITQYCTWYAVGDLILIGLRFMTISLKTCYYYSTSLYTIYYSCKIEFSQEGDQQSECLILQVRGSINTGLRGTICGTTWSGQGRWPCLWPCQARVSRRRRGGTGLICTLPSCDVRYHHHLQTADQNKNLMPLVLYTVSNLARWKSLNIDIN